MTTTLEEAPPIEGTSNGPDADKGQLFEVPRVAVTVDESDPGIIKLAFSGSIELDRASADDVALYNSLTAGQTVSLQVDAHVAGAKTSHRRDSEGDVDAIVQTKSLVVSDVYLERPEG